MSNDESEEFVSIAGGLKAIGEAITEAFVYSGENRDQCLVGVLDNLAFNLNEGSKLLANAIIPSSAVGNFDAAGVHVTSLTESVMGVTAGLVRIADAMESIASVIRETNKQ